MGWSIGWDQDWKRDIGYGVPAWCDHPKCKKKIDRGLSYLCAGENGCGLFFCGEHLDVDSHCHRCRCRYDPFAPRKDHPEWIKHKATDESWAEWRKTEGGREYLKKYQGGIPAGDPLIIDPGAVLHLDRIYRGDVRHTLSRWKAKTVQTVVTSPPYWGLRDYGVPGQIGLEPTPEAYVATLREVFREVHRVLRSDGTLWLNLGDCYVDAGGAGGQGATGQRAGRRHTQKALKKRVSTPGCLEGSAAGQAHALRADEAGRFAPGLKPKDLVGIPWRVAFALQADGWFLRSDIIWHKPNPMPESVTDRPTKAHEYLFLLSKRERYLYDAEAIKEPCSEAFLNDRRHFTGSTQAHIKDGYAAAGAQNPKGPHRLFGRRPSVKRGEFAGKTNALPGREAFRAVRENRNKRSVWTIATKPFPEAHFATFPERLVEPCILAGSRPGDVVLDPFMGGGTVALVAARLNRRFLGVELNPDYIKIARKRIGAEVRQTKMVFAVSDQ